MRLLPYRELAERIVEGDGVSSKALRRSAFENKGLSGPAADLAHKVAFQPTRVTDRDFEGARASGLEEDEIFELVICAAVGQAARQYEAALAALGQAQGESAGSRAP